MAKRYFNWKLGIVLIISLAVLGVTAFGLRQWQRANRADQGLILGNKAYDEQKWSEAVENLGRYLAVEKNDISVLMKYADAHLKIRPSRSSNIVQAVNAYRAVLRADKNNSKAALQLTGLYLLGDPGKAELIVSKYLDNNDDPAPELRRMLAVALAGQRKFSEAAAELEAIIREHPDQISAYEILGRLIERQPDDIPGSAESWFNEAVNKNPSSALAYTVRAGFYRRNKEFSKALADLDQAEKLDISDPNVELRLAGELINANILDKAEKHLTAVKSSLPTNQNLWVIWAELAVKSESKEKMLEIAEKGLKELSSQPWDFMPIATELFIGCDQLDRADECISQMNQKDIAPPRVAYLEGLLAEKRGRLFEAVNYLKESIGLSKSNTPPDPRIRLALSSALSRLGDTQSALRQLRTLVYERPDSVAGYLELARLLAQIGNWPESARYAEAAIKLSPGNLEASLLYLQAQVYLRQTDSSGEIAQALQDLEKVAGDLLEFRLLKFKHALQQDNFEDAQELITQLKKDYPSQIEIIMAEVNLLIDQDKIDEAIMILSEVLKKFPQAVQPVRYLAFLLARQGNKERSEEILKEALERIDQPVSRRILGLLLSEYYIQLNQKENAYLLLNSLVQELPEDITLKRALLNCEQVVNDPERAQKNIDDIKSLESEDGWQWRYERAKIWYLSEDEDFEAHYTQIISLLQENLQANPNDQESRMLLAAAYNRSGELQLAISAYREALSRSPNNLSIIIPLIDVLSRSMEFDEVDQLLNRVSAGNLNRNQLQIFRPQLQIFQYQSYLRHGQYSSASDILQELVSNDPNNQANRITLARLYMGQNKYEDAEKLLAHLKIQNPDSTEIAAAQVQLNIRQNKTEEALRLCDEIVNSLQNAQAYIFRAQTYASVNQIDKALEDLERAAIIDPGNVEVWMTKSDFYRSDGRLDKAIADIQQALSLASDDVRVQKQAILLLLYSGDPDKVLQGKTILEKALGTNPDDTELLLFKVDSLLAERTRPAKEKAEEILQKITDDHPKISKAWVILGDMAIDKKQAGRAMEIAFRGLSHTPNNRELLLLKARAEEARSPVLAIPTLKSMLEIDPNYINTTLHLASIYIEVGEFEKAVNLLETQLTHYVGTLGESEIKAILAKALYKNRNNVDAQRKYNSLIQSEKDSLTLVKIARNLQEFTDSRARNTAEGILRRVLEKEPDSVGAMVSLAIHLQTSGRSDEALLRYRQVLELQPNNLMVINNLAWLLCEDKEEFKDALELAEKGLKINPNYIDLNRVNLIDTRGVIYYRMGEFNKAIEDFTNCIELYPEERPEATGSHFHLAKAYQKLGQNDKAVEYLNLALDRESQIGGLSASQLAEAQNLLKQLQEGK
jgi:tetratricopeptide (TPR) repeat protein